MSLQDIGVKGFMQLLHYTFKPLATKKLWFKQDCLPKVMSNVLKYSQQNVFVTEAAVSD